MEESNSNVLHLDQIVDITVETIEQGKKQLFVIAESARSECDDIREQLEKLEVEIEHTVKYVDELENREKECRQKLLSAGKDFSGYSEHDIRDSYETARMLQIKLALRRDKEQQLIAKRTELEYRLRKAKNTFKKAEDFVTHVGVALNFLSGNLMDFSKRLVDFSQKQTLGSKIIMAQEEERHKLARDMHDGPAQSLSNIVLKAGICEKLIDVDMDRARGELDELKFLTRDCLNEMRRIIYDLRPMSLDDLGLIPTLEKYMLDYEKENHTHVQFSCSGENVKIKSLVEVALFRIIQEILNNIKKHAHADKIIMKLDISREKIKLNIRDNGVGFDEKKVLAEEKGASSGFGLYSIKQRVEILNGTINIQSAVGHGTRINISIPLNSEEEEEKNEQSKSFNS